MNRFDSLATALMKVVLVIRAGWLRLIMFITICLQKLISSGTALNSFALLAPASYLLEELREGSILQPGHLLVIKDGAGGVGYLMIPESCERPGITGITPR